MTAPRGRHTRIFSAWPCPVSTCGKYTLRQKDHRPRSISGDPEIHTTLFVCESCGCQPYSESRLVGQWKKSFLPYHDSGKRRAS